MTDPWPRILVGVPLGKFGNNHAFQYFWNIAKQGWPLIEGIPPDPRLDVQRNIMAAKAEKSGATHLCLLDADHLHPADIVNRFAEHVIADSEKKVICGYQFRRHPPFNPCVYRYDELGNADWVYPPTGELIKVDGGSAASILINVEVFRQIKPPWWAYTYELAERHQYLGTDNYFNQLLRDNGIGIWCDTSITSPHLDNSAVITEAIFAEFQKQMATREPRPADVKTRIEA